MAAEFKGQQNLTRRLRAIEGGKRDLLRRLQIDTVYNAKKRTVAFRKTGNLGRTIAPGAFSGSSALVVAKATYARYIEEGTGIYGPRKRPIVPKTKKVLAWRTGAVTLGGRSRVKGGRQIAGWAFARSVKGRKATPYLVPGAQDALKKNGLKDVVVELWNGAA